MFDYILIPLYRTLFFNPRFNYEELRNFYQIINYALYSRMNLLNQDAFMIILRISSRNT
ncbi:hypothetical protein pb186bvf_007262 [Paramecium bursaria]